MTMTYRHARVRWVCTALVLTASACFGQSIPAVPELADDPWNFDSPLWERAALIEGFKVVDQDAAADPQTLVRLAHDTTHLYIRFTAMDANIDQAVAKPLDEFADDFPLGDHGEIWVSQHGTLVFAFDCHGNRYDALNFDNWFYSGFLVRSRMQPDRWESIIVIPLESLFSGKVGDSLSLAFVRHLDHGRDDAVRSTATGKRATSRVRFKLEPVDDTTDET